jgi:hypothetical protein
MSQRSLTRNLADEGTTFAEILEQLRRRLASRPEQVLRYLSRYTHRVAISNRRLVAADNTSIAFRWKDYRINGPGRWKTMRLHPHEFIRRFLMHELPKGFHRIRHYGSLPTPTALRTSRQPTYWLHIVPPADPQKQPDITLDALRVLPCPCPRCGARMIVISGGRQGTARGEAGSFLQRCRV